MKFDRRMLAAFTIVSLAFLSTAAQAINGTWTSAAGGNWDETSKWSGGTVADGVDATASFNADCPSAGTRVTNNAARTIGNLSFRDSSGSDSWTVTNANNDANTITLSTSSGTPTITTTNSTSVFFDTILAGSQGVILAPQSGKFVRLRKANTFSGVTTVRNGYAGVSVNAPSGQAGALGNDTSAVQVGDSGTPSDALLGVRLAPAVTNARPIVVNDYGDKVQLGVDDAGGAAARVLLGDITLNRDTYLGGYAAPVEFRGAISGPGGIIVGGANSTAANTVKLYGTNTFAGPTTVSEGSLEIYTNAASGNATSTIILGDADTGASAVKLLIRVGTELNRNLSIPNVSAGTVTIGAIQLGPVGKYNFNGTIQADRDILLNSYTTSHELHFLNTISGTGRVLTAGSGEVFLYGTNTFTGDFVHNVGNSTVHFYDNVASGTPGPLGNSTNPVRFANADGNRHYFYASGGPIVFSRPISVEEGVWAVIGTDNLNASGTEYSGDISYAGDLALNVYGSGAVAGEARFSGKLSTATNRLSVQGASSAGNYCTLSNPGNTLAGTITIGGGSRLVVAASGALAGATSIVMGAASGVNPTALLTDGSVTVTQVVYFSSNTQYNASNPHEIGSRTAGDAVFSGNFFITRTNQPPIVNFVAASGSVVRFTGAINGNNCMPRKTGLGVLWFEGPSTYTNDTLVNGGTFGAVDGVGLPTSSRLYLTNGVFESNGSFTRSLGSSAGTVGWNAGTTLGGGFSAKGGKLTVNLNGGGADNLQWGTTADFTRGPLWFNSPAADSEMEWIDNIDLGTTARTMLAYDNPATRNDKANLSGVLSGVATLTKSGEGVLVLSATNTITNAVTVSAGTLMINGALTNGAGSLTVANGACLGGKGTILRRIVMQDGSGFDWANDPGTLTVATNLAFPTNGLFRFVYSASATPAISCAGTLTLPATATVDMVALPGAGDAPYSSVILQANTLVGNVAGWTITNNARGHALTKVGNTVVLQLIVKGTLIMVK